MRILLTLCLAVFSAAAVVYGLPESQQVLLERAPVSRPLPEPHRVLEELRAELRDSRATVIQANYTTYELDAETEADESGVLLPNPRVPLMPSPAPGTASY